MYSEPSNIRKHAVKVRFNDDEIKVVDAMANLSRKQRATFLRELLIEIVNGEIVKKSMNSKVG